MRRIVLIALLVLLAVSGSTQAFDKVKVSMGGAYDEIRAFQQEEVVYVSLSELVEILGGSLSWQTVGQRIDYTDAGFKFEFVLDAPFIRLNDTTYNMTYPALLSEGQLCVPVVTFLPFLDRVTSRQLTWIERDREIKVESDYFNVTDLSIQRKANGLLIEIYITKPLAYQIFVTEGNWLNVSIRDGLINSSRVMSRRNHAFMYNMKVHQIENNTGQISIRLRRAINNYNHEIKYNPTRIQITIADADFELDTTAKPLLGPDDKIDVIVIDAGHGGQDYGAIGGDGTREKDVVLEIAKKLAKLIRKDKQFKVVMTRDRDKTVSLEDRAKIANDAGADLFVSIHANASPKRHVRGWNVFFLAPALNDSARSVEQLENSYFLRESYTGTAADTESEAPYVDPVLSILNEMLMTEFQAESYDFAQMCDRELRKRLKTPARGIDQAGFFVLNKVFTPSVLIETAFISNSSEEKLLKSGGYQDDIAEGLYQAIKRFKAKYESN